MSDARWRKSSFSGSQANCVEVAGQDERVLVRDTKDRAGAVLRFSPAAWRRFAEQAKRSLGRPSLGWPVRGRGSCARQCPFTVSGVGTASETPGSLRAGGKVRRPRAGHRRGDATAHGLRGAHSQPRRYRGERPRMPSDQ